MTDTNARQAILEKIRRALSAASHEGSSAEKESNSAAEEDRKSDRQRDELIQQFSAELTRIGGQFRRVSTDEAAYEYIEQVALDRSAKSVVAWNVKLLGDLDLRARFEAKSISFDQGINDRRSINKAAEAEVGVSGVEYVLADTGTLVLFAGVTKPRSVSLLPPAHIAIIRPEQILPGLNELFPLLHDGSGPDRILSSAITFITGPSRTADIELKLVVGVHGPQELHALLIG